MEEVGSRLLFRYRGEGGWRVRLNERSSLFFVSYLCHVFAGITREYGEICINWTFP